MYEFPRSKRNEEDRGTSLVIMKEEDWYAKKNKKIL